MATWKQDLIKLEVHLPQPVIGSCKILDGYEITWAYLIQFKDTWIELAALMMNTNTIDGWVYFEVGMISWQSMKQNPIALWRKKFKINLNHGEVTKTIRGSSIRCRCKKHNGEKMSMCINGQIFMDINLEKIM